MLLILLSVHPSYWKCILFTMPMQEAICVCSNHNKHLHTLLSILAAEMVHSVVACYSKHGCCVTLQNRVNPHSSETKVTCKRVALDSLHFYSGNRQGKTTSAIHPMTSISSKTSCESHPLQTRNSSGQDPKPHSFTLHKYSKVFCCILSHW